MAIYTTKEHLADFTEKLLVNDKKIRDELKEEISKLPSGGTGSSYTLPTASETELGGVKVDGTTITIDGDGVISATSNEPIKIREKLVLEQGKFDIKNINSTDNTVVRSQEISITGKSIVKLEYDETKYDVIYLIIPIPKYFDDMKWGTRKTFVVEDHKMRFEFKNKERTPLTPEEIGDIYYTVVESKEGRKNQEPNTIILAATDSSESDIELADYLCDGINDEVEIQNAIKELENVSGTIVLCDGHYNIDALTYSGNDKIGYLGIYMTNPTKNHHLRIKGFGKPNRIGSADVGGTATINLTRKAMESINKDTDRIRLISAISNGISSTSIGDRSYPNMNMAIENISINIYSNKYPCVCIDGYFLASMIVKHVFIGISGILSDNANENCVGIRTVDGTNFGTGYAIDHTFVWGMGVGYWIGGEHLIMQEAGCRLCDISYKFGGFASNLTRASHPITLINCCEEECKRSMYFCANDKKQAINIVDYNIEDRPYQFSGTYDSSTKAVEERPGDYTGTITFAANYEDYINRGTIRFWEGTSGKNFKTINLAHKLSGTTDERPEAPNLNQQYFDTTLNKMICFIGGKWVDYSGAQVEDRTYTVTNNLTGCTSSNSATDIVERKSYKATITADSGNTLTKVEYTMGGAKYKVKNGAINIPYVTGDIVITATAEAN